MREVLIQGGMIVGGALGGLRVVGGGPRVGGAQLPRAGGAAAAAGQAANMPAWARAGLNDLARFRAQLGPIPGGGMANGGVLARLDIGGRSFYGINAHGQRVTLRVNPISRSHAETDAFQQAFNGNLRGGNARLFVDAELCGACDRSGAVRSMARQLGIRQLDIVTPSGVVTVAP
jgi:MafB19-like deaminase